MKISVSVPAGAFGVGLDGEIRTGGLLCDQSQGVLCRERANSESDEREGLPVHDVRIEKQQPSELGARVLTVGDQGRGLESDASILGIDCKPAAGDRLVDGVQDAHEVALNQCRDGDGQRGHNTEQ